MIYIVMVALLSAWVCWWLAVRRGQRGTGWFLVGLVLGPLAVIIQMLLFRIQAGHSDDDIGRMAALKTSIVMGEQKRVANFMAQRSWTDEELSYLMELADLNGQPEIHALIEQAASRPD